MIDTELRELFAQAPDRTLDELEPDVWRHAAAFERARRVRRGVVALQTTFLAAAFAASAAAGMHWARSREPPELGVFSPQLPLNASVLLAGKQP